MSQDNTLMNKSIMVDALNAIGREMASLGKIVEFAIFGGSAIILTFDFRDATHDIDFMLVSGDHADLLKVAKQVGDERCFTGDWFNDAVEIFASDNPAHNLMGEFPKENPGIRVFSASPEYILSMKIYPDKKLPRRNELLLHDMFDEKKNKRAYNPMVGM